MVWKQRWDCEAVISSHLKANECGCEEITRSSKNAVDELLKIVEFNKSLFSQLHPSVFFDLQKFHPEAWSLFNDFKTEFILAKVKANMRAGH